MRKFIDGYAKLLNWLLGMSVAILVIPVTLQMLSRQTGLIPAWIWTEEMARFFFIWMVMLGAMVACARHTLRRRRLADEHECGASYHLDGVRAPVRVRIRLVRLRFLQFGWARPRSRGPADGMDFAAWPLTGLTWLLFGLHRLRRDLRIASTAWTR